MPSGSSFRARLPLSSELELELDGGARLTGRVSVGAGVGLNWACASSGVANANSRHPAWIGFMLPTFLSLRR